MKEKINTIIYNPLSWIHESRMRVPETYASIRCKRIINDIIIENFSLPTGELNLDNSKGNYLIKNWFFLRTAALMVVCNKYRAKLAYNGQFCLLEKNIKGFTFLKFDTLYPDLDSRITANDLWSSAENLLINFGENASQVLKARLPLLFKRTPGEDHIISPSPRDDELLFRMAIQYAKNQ